MHLFLMNEGYPNNLEMFDKWVASRRYDHISSPHSKWGVKVRKFEFMNLVFPEEWKDPLLQDLRAFMKLDERFHGIQQNFIVKKLFSKMKIKPLDLEYLKKIPKSNTKTLGNPKFWTYVYPIGIMEDRKPTSTIQKGGVTYPVNQEMI